MSDTTTTTWTAYLTEGEREALDFAQQRGVAGWVNTLRTVAALRMLVEEFQLAIESRIGRWQLESFGFPHNSYPSAAFDLLAILEGIPIEQEMVEGLK